MGGKININDQVALQIGRLTLELIARDAELAALRERLAALEPAESPKPPQA